MSKFKFVNKILRVLGWGMVVFSVIWSVYLSDFHVGLSTDYIFESINEGNTDVYDPETELWSTLSETIERSDVVVAKSDEGLVVRSVFRGITDEGRIIFEASSRYGVDPVTHENVVGLGDFDRQGYFLFPVLTKPQDYLFHSPEVVEAPALAKYARADKIHGLDVLVFEYEIDEIDKTKYFPDYLSKGGVVTGDHLGALWVEPFSGTIVNWHHQGSNRVELNGEVYPFQRWQNGFALEVVKERVAYANQQKLLVVFNKFLLPIGFLFVGFILIFKAFVNERKK